MAVNWAWLIAAAALAPASRPRAPRYGVRDTACARAAHTAHALSVSGLPATGTVQPVTAPRRASAPLAASRRCVARSAGHKESRPVGAPRSPHRTEELQTPFAPVRTRHQPLQPRPRRCPCVTRALRTVYCACLAPVLVTTATSVDQASHVVLAFVRGTCVMSSTRGDTAPTGAASEPQQSSASHQTPGLGEGTASSAVQPPSDATLASAPAGALGASRSATVADLPDLRSDHARAISTHGSTPVTHVSGHGHGHTTTRRSLPARGPEMLSGFLPVVAAPSVWTDPEVGASSQLVSLSSSGGAVGSDAPATPEEEPRAHRRIVAAGASLTVTSRAASTSGGAASAGLVPWPGASADAGGSGAPWLLVGDESKSTDGDNPAPVVAVVTPADLLSSLDRYLGRFYDWFPLADAQSWPIGYSDAISTLTSTCRTLVEMSLTTAPAAWALDADGHLHLCSDATARLAHTAPALRASAAASSSAAVQVHGPPSAASTPCSASAAASVSASGAYSRATTSSATRDALADSAVLAILAGEGSGVRALLVPSLVSGPASVWANGSLAPPTDQWQRVLTVAAAVAPIGASSPALQSPLSQSVVASVGAGAPSSYPVRLAGMPRAKRMRADV